MTIKEIFDGIEDFDEKQKVAILPMLFSGFTKQSQQELLAFQANWDGSKPYSEFVAGQTKIAKAMIELEIGPIGQTVRQFSGLPEWTWETEIV